MIVKNEAHVIRRCLDSLRMESWIDYCCIVDTGSTDGTQQIISDYLNEMGIDGEVLEYPFTDFADCRNYALANIEYKVDFVFWIDADEQLQFSKNFDFAKFKRSIANLDFVYFTCLNNGFQFVNNHLFSTQLNWEWHGLVHEYLRVRDVRNSSWIKFDTIKDCSIIYNEDGASWKDKEGKAKRHIELLLEQHRLEPQNPRWSFYLGQTYRAINNPESIRESIKWYEYRVDSYESGASAEAYVAKLMSLCLRQQLGETILPSQFRECEKYDKRRIEHVIHANHVYWKQQNYQAAYKYSSEAVKSFMKPPIGHSDLMMDLSIYTFSCAHVHAINCFYTKHRHEGLAILEKLIANIKSGASPALVSNDELQRLKKALKDLS